VHKKCTILNTWDESRSRISSLEPRDFWWNLSLDVLIRSQSRFRRLRSRLHHCYTWSVCDLVVFAHLQCGLEPRNLDGTSLGSCWCRRRAGRIGQRILLLPCSDVAAIWTFWIYPGAANISLKWYIVENILHFHSEYKVFHGFFNHCFLNSNCFSL